jgi:hypothetical protein
LSRIRVLEEGGRVFEQGRDIRRGFRFFRDRELPEHIRRRDFKALTSDRIEQGEPSARHGRESLRDERGNLIAERVNAIGAVGHRRGAVEDEQNVVDTRR